MTTSMTTAQPNPKPENALEIFSGSYRDPHQITTIIKKAMEVGNVLSPMTTGTNMPPFHEVAVSLVLADCEVDKRGFPVRPGEIYMMSRNSYGLAKPFLNRLKRGIGVVWVPEQCGRRDDESDPYFVRHFSFGVVQKFDGGIETIKGTKTFDLRDGSARIKKMITKKIASAIYDLKYDAREKQFRITDELIRKARQEAEEKAWENINEQRAEIETLAETGSEMRALRSLGLKTAYTLPELQRPFIIFSLTVTGRHENPVLEEFFAREAAKRALDSRRSLYGSTPIEPMTIPAELLNQQAVNRTPPPPVGARDAEDDLEDLGSGPVIEVETEHSRGSIDDAVEALDAQDNAEPERGPEPTPLVMPFGDHAGKFLDDSSVEIEDLDFVKDWLVGAIANPEKADKKLEFTALKNAVEVEIRRRRIPADRRPMAGSTAQSTPPAQPNRQAPNTQQARTQTKSERF